MSYLILSDYKKLIQTDNLAQIIGNDSQVLADIEMAAIAEAKSYLVQKYVTDEELVDTQLWNVASLYRAGDRIYIDAAAYNVAIPYTVDELCLYSGNIYKSIAGNAPGAFNVNEWTLLGRQFAMFQGTYPQPRFLLTTEYKTGDITFYNGRSYTATRTIRNIFPDASATYWTAGSAYTIAAGTVPSNNIYWTAGDSRNSQLVNFCIDIALYHVHSRISPRNIPDLRVKRYDDAIKWLKGAAQGTYITADLPLIQPRSGQRIRWGGNEKNINIY